MVGVVVAFVGGVVGEHQSVLEELAQEVKTCWGADENWVEGDAGETLEGVSGAGGS